MKASGMAWPRVPVRGVPPERGRSRGPRTHPLASPLALLLLLLGLSSPGAALARNLGELGIAGLAAAGAVAGAPGDSKQPRYDTAYACEGKTLTIACRPGEQIHLIRANYGRFSITICNDHGNTEWSVNCMSPKSLRVLHNKCSEQQSCSVAAHTSMFGDPCPGTLKYLEAHYQCSPVSSQASTPRASPPWLQTPQPTVWSTAKLPPGLLKPAAPPQPPPQPAAGSSSTTLAPATDLEAAAGPGAAAAAPEGAGATGTSTATSQTTGRPGAAPVPAPQPQPPPQQERERERGRERERELEREREQETALEPAPAPPPAPSPASAPGSGREPGFGSVEQPQPPAVDQQPPTSSTPASSTSIIDNSLSSSNPWFQGELSLCSPVTARGLYWNFTRAGEVAVQACPGGATGVAKWRCSQSSMWEPETPDLSECRSVWLTSLESRVNEGDSLISIANDLSQVTSSKTLYGGDMMTTTKIMKAMAEKMAKDSQTFPDLQQREAIVTELLHGAVRTGSNLLDSAHIPSWHDLSYREQMLAATSLLIGLEENAFLVADAVMAEKTVIQSFKNILLSVRILENRSIGLTEQFPTNAALQNWDGRLVSDGDWLELPRGALLDNSDKGLVRLVFVAFDRLEEILQPKGDPVENSVGVVSNVTRVLNSKIISASLGKGRHIQLSEPVRLTLKHIRTENVSNPSCVFWDYTMSSWSEEGCRVRSNNQTHTVCECEHLTNFAVLMDVHSTLLPQVHQAALQVITYVGCVISVVCLVLAILTFQLFRGLKVKRNSAGNRLPRRHLCRSSCSATSRSSSHSQMLSQLCSRREQSSCQCGAQDESCSQMQDLCSESCTPPRNQVHNHINQLCGESFNQPHSLITTQPRSQVHSHPCNERHLCVESCGENCNHQAAAGMAPCTQSHSHAYEDAHGLRPQQVHCDTYGRTCISSRNNTLTRSSRSCSRGHACDTLRSQAHACDGPNSLPAHLPQPHSCNGNYTLRHTRPPSQNRFCETRCDSVSDQTCQIYNELSNHSRSHTPTCAQALHSLEPNYWSRRPVGRQRNARHDVAYNMEIPRVYSRALSDDSPEYEYIS